MHHLIQPGQQPSTIVAIENDIGIEQSGRGGDGRK